MVELAICGLDPNSIEINAKTSFDIAGYCLEPFISLCVHTWGSNQSAWLLM